MMTDPHKGHRVFTTNWPAHRTVAIPPVIKVPERNETDIRDVADMISPLTESERADLRNAIFADAVKRVGATLAETVTEIPSLGEDAEACAGPG